VKRLNQLIWSAFAVAMIALVVTALVFQSRRTPLPVLHSLSPFLLTNQLGAAVTPESLRGQVVIANVVFSRCPTQCHQLSQQMSRIQAVTGEDVRLISLTADPVFDSPAVLHKYGERYGSDPSRWWFLTGPKSEVYRVAEKDLLFSVMDTGEANPKLEDRFIHSGNYVLIDRQGRLRAIVQSDEAGAEDRLRQLAERLRKEKP